MRVRVRVRVRVRAGRTLPRSRELEGARQSEGTQEGGVDAYVDVSVVEGELEERGEDDKRVEAGEGVGEVLVAAICYHLHHHLRGEASGEYDVGLFEEGGQFRAHAIVLAHHQPSVDHDQQHGEVSEVGVVHQPEQQAA